MQPIILTAADNKFKEFIPFWQCQVEKFNYDPLIRDLGGLGIGTPYQNDQPILTKYDDSLPETVKVKVGNTIKTNRKALGNFKPKCLLDAMESVSLWKWMVWLDADAFIVKSINELFQREYEYDVAVTIRHSNSKKRSSRFLNSGVVVVKNSIGAYKFVQQWVKEQEDPSCQHDQSALHNVFYNWDFPLKPSFANRTFYIHGTLVKCLPWKKYNQTFSSLEKFKEVLGKNEASIWHLQKGYFDETKEVREVVFNILNNA